MPPTILLPGDVVTADFPGVNGVKRRPTIVISTEQYHRSRPDVVIGVLTSQLDSATTPMDYALQDWKMAGLVKPSAFRSFFATLPALAVARIGHCSDRDWQEIQQRLTRAISLPQ